MHIYADRYRYISAMILFTMQENETSGVHTADSN